MTNLSQYFGVIEGFYGRPWSVSQRKSLIDQFIEFGELNTYVYAPKDDFKHRQRWRELYTPSELTELSEIINKCQQANVRFIYSISPGLDIVYSSTKDYNCLINKLLQLLSVGIDGIAILFDDIPNKMHSIDLDRFESFSKAQASISNLLMTEINVKEWFFCPTVYCDDQAGEKLSKNKYLLQLSNYLDKKFNLFWTGPHVVSPTINKNHLIELKSIFKNPIIIWDNLFANDYDLHRCFMGPFSGREGILGEVNGILLNPNCEFNLNYIPLKTFSDYCNNNTVDSFKNAIDAWYEKFDQVITINELKLLINTFYLPHCFGETAISMFEKIKSNNFDNSAENAWDVLEKLAALKNRELFHSIYRYAWEYHRILKKYIHKHNGLEDTHTDLGSMENILL